MFNILQFYITVLIHFPLHTCIWEETWGLLKLDKPPRVSGSWSSGTEPCVLSALHKKDSEHSGYLEWNQQHKNIMIMDFIRKHLMTGRAAMVHQILLKIKLELFSRQGSRMVLWYSLVKMLIISFRTHDSCEHDQNKDQMSGIMWNRRVKPAVTQGPWNAE